MYKRLISAIAGAVMLVMVTAGCSQNIVYREFYAPTDNVKLIRGDGTTVGAVKIEATKAGAPNWSDNKTLNLSFFGL